MSGKEEASTFFSSLNMEEVVTIMTLLKFLRRLNVGRGFKPVTIAKLDSIVGLDDFFVKRYSVVLEELEEPSCVEEIEIFLARFC